jgi:hypothetical protein
METTLALAKSGLIFKSLLAMMSNEFCRMESAGFFPFRASGGIGIKFHGITRIPKREFSKNSCTEFRISLPLGNGLCHFNPILYILLISHTNLSCIKNNAYALVLARS